MTNRLLNAWNSSRGFGDIDLAVALGLLQGVSPIHIRGRNPAIGNSYESLWMEGGLYAYLGAASVLKISSTDADDAAGDTGARTVQITGLDANLAPLTETVTMNGQTAVNTVGSYLRVFRVEVLTTGATLSNEGIIYAGTGNVVAGVPDTKYAHMPANDNITHLELYTVPAGKVAACRGVLINNNAGGSSIVTARLMARPLGLSFIPELEFVNNGSNDTNYQHRVPMLFEAGTDIELRAVNSIAGTVIVNAIAEMIEADV